MSVRPFSSGSQYENWSDANCGGCTKSDYPDELREPPCPLELALLEACFGDGEVSDDVASRMGATENRGRYCWRCKEREPKEVPLVG